jgi:hypothetical protein
LTPDKDFNKESTHTIIFFLKTETKPIGHWILRLILNNKLDLSGQIKVNIAQGFAPGTSVSSTNKTDHHDITDILLKVALNTHSTLCYIDLDLSRQVQFVIKN